MKLLGGDECEKIKEKSNEYIWTLVSNYLILYKLTIYHQIFSQLQIEKLKLKIL